MPADWLLNIFDPWVFTNLVLPSLFLGAALVCRLVLALPFTSAADTLLAIIAFDATGIVAAGEFKRLFASDKLAADVVQVHLAFGLIALVFWYLIVHFGERILMAQTAAGALRSGKSWAVAGSGVAAAALVIALHVFIYRAQTGQS